MPHDPHLADLMRQALVRPGAKPMDITGKPMSGFVRVDAALDAVLDDWISLCRRFAGGLPPK